MDEEQVLMAANKIGQRKSKFIYKETYKPKNAEEKFLRDFVMSQEFKE